MTYKNRGEPPFLIHIVELNLQDLLRSSKKMHLQDTSYGCIEVVYILKFIFARAF